MSSASPHRLARAWGSVLLRVTASIDMYDVGALVGWYLRVVGRHIDLFCFSDDDDVLPREEQSEMIFSGQCTAFITH